MSFPYEFGPALRRVVAGMLLVFGWLLVGPVQASHIRAGDIQATVDRNNLLRYSFVLHVYTDDNSSVDEGVVTICFSDGTSTTVQRSRPKMQLPNQVSLNVFEFAHAFPGPGRYTVSYQGNNRNSTIQNLGTNPESLSFYIVTTVLIDATAGPNATVQFRNPPIDRANIGQRFTHSPGAYNSDGDRLRFRLIEPRQGNGTVAVPCAVAPNPVASPIPTYTSPLNYTMRPQVFKIDSLTGNIEWNAPNTLGEFNFAFICEEWRLQEDSTYRLISSVVRDMQVTVTNALNQPPQVTGPRDTCVIANTTVRKVIKASDPDAGQRLSLSAIGQPFELGATFVAVGSGTNPTSKRFEWTPACNTVRREPYIVTFKATDSLTNNATQLADLYDWRIRVVGPPPQNVQPSYQGGNRIRLTWTSYVCAGPADSIRIYRKTDSTGFVPDVCETGVPARLGYTYIGSVPASATSFDDLNGGQRLRMGQRYCYLIYAVWIGPAGGESLASEEACLVIPGLLPHLINADVMTTDSLHGQVTVRWTRGDPGPLPAIYVSSYQLSRAVAGAAGGAATYTLVRAGIPLTDTTLVDTDLNTLREQYRYRLEMVSAPLQPNTPTFRDTADQATTPRLDGSFAGSTVSLAWRYEVPWDNTARRHYIYRQVQGAFALIDSVQATTAAGAYVDRFTYAGIPFGRERTYTYRVLTRGLYTVGDRAPHSTYNYSQDFTVTPAPCPPVLTLLPPDCAQEARNCAEVGLDLVNQLTWVPNVTPPCSPAIARYNVYFRATAEGELTLLGTTTQLTYLHARRDTRIGCYAVTAVDSSGIESEKSNIVCQDNCQYFKLPNVITPNGDSHNDQLEPLCASPLRRVKFTVYNRWGRKVYESEADPRINWHGTDDSGKRLSDGTYFYRAEVEFDVLNPQPQYFKGWVEVIDNLGNGPTN